MKIKTSELTGATEMIKHTPGPWAFCNDTLCAAHGNYMHLGKWVESPGLGKAAEPNKRLIESAPELLAALQAIIEEAGPQYGNDDGPGCVNRMARIARAAIRKATGEQA